MQPTQLTFKDFESQNNFDTIKYGQYAIWVSKSVCTKSYGFLAHTHLPCLELRPKKTFLKRDLKKFTHTSFVQDPPLICLASAGNLVSLRVISAAPLDFKVKNGPSLLMLIVIVQHWIDTIIIIYDIIIILDMVSCSCSEKPWNLWYFDSSHCWLCQRCSYHIIIRTYLTLTNSLLCMLYYSYAAVPKPCLSSFFLGIRWSNISNNPFINKRLRMTITS